jgi:hypothetical protein
VYLLVFNAYINEMHGSRSKISSKTLVRQRCSEGFNSGLTATTWEQMYFSIQCDPISRNILLFKAPRLRHFVLLERETDGVIIEVIGKKKTCRCATFSSYSLNYI